MWENGIKRRKSNVDNLVSRNPLNCNILITSAEFLIDEKKFSPDLSNISTQCRMTLVLSAVTQAIND